MTILSNLSQSFKFENNKMYSECTPKEKNYNFLPSFKLLRNIITNIRMAVYILIIKKFWSWCLHCQPKKSFIFPYFKSLSWMPSVKIISKLNEDLIQIWNQLISLTEPTQIYRYLRSRHFLSVHIFFFTFYPNKILINYLFITL